MHGEMTTEFVRAGEPLGTVRPRARVWLLSGVGSHVGLQVIGSGELSLADFAGEGSDAGVFSAVSSQLVGAGESLAATLVIADVRLLSRVLPDVHLQVRELEVALGAAGVETDKRLSLFLRFSSGRLLSDERARLVLHWLSHLRDDEGRVRGHGHLHRGGALELVGIGGETRWVGHQLQRDGDGLVGGLVLLEVSLVRVVLLGVQLLRLRLRVGVGEHGVRHTVATVHAGDGLLGGDRGREVLQRHRGDGVVAHVGDGGTDGRGEVRERLLVVVVAVHHLR